MISMWKCSVLLRIKKKKGNLTKKQNNFALNIGAVLVNKHRGSKGGPMVRALASHQCVPGSNSSVDAICGLSLLMVLSLAPRGFSPGTPVFPSLQKPTFPNSNLTRNQVDEEPPCGCTCYLHMVIYLFYLFI